MTASGGAPVRLVRDGPVPEASCPHCGGQLQLSTVGSAWHIHRPSDVADRLMLQLGTLEREELHVLLLNTRNVVLAQERIYQGNVSASVVRVGELFTEAVRRHARSILVVHNHPSGDPSPSSDDIHLTAEAIAAGRLLDITVLDHVIVGGGSWVSLRDQGLAFGKDGDHRAADGSGRSAFHVAYQRQQAPGSRVREASPPTRQDRLHLHVDPDGQVVDDAGHVYDVAEAAEKLPWRWALPSNGSPHQYVVQARSPIEAFDILATAIDHHPARFLAYHRGYQRANRYWEHQGPSGSWRCWRTSAGGGRGVTMMLNRCRPDSDILRPLEAGPADWAGGPPWLEYGAPWPPGWVRVAGARGQHGEWTYERELDIRNDYRCRGCGRQFFWFSGRSCPSCGTAADEALL